MQFIKNIHDQVTGFITREFTNSPHDLDDILTITAIRLVAGLAYLAFAALAFLLMVAIITFVLANFGVIILSLGLIALAYFVGILVVRRIIDINRDKDPAVEPSPAMEAAAA